MAILAASSPAEAQPFHTSPECWPEPRLYHAGPPAAELAQRIHVIETPKAIVPAGIPMVSPNGAYRLWVRNPDTSQPGPWGAAIVIDVERDTRPTLLFDDVAGSIESRWVNEKLIFARVAWGRIVFADVLFDVEKREIVFHEEVRDGQIAFAQFREAFGGRCPGAREMQSAGSQELPVSKSGSRVPIGMLDLPEVFGPGETGGLRGPDDPRPVEVFLAPRAGADAILRSSDFRAFEYREIGYEAGAAVVYERTDGWYRIGLAGPGERSGWVAATAERQFVPVGKLLTGKLAYLNEHWDRKVWSAPEAGARATELPKREGRQEYSVDIREARETVHGLWLRVAVYDGDPCSGGQPGVALEGWVPAYSKEGDLVAWFHSRGC